MDQAQTKNYSAANGVAGWILLAAGIIIIIWGIYSSYQIFSAKSPVPELFKAPITSELLAEKDKAGISVKKSETIDIAKLQNMNPQDLQKVQEQQQKEMQDALQKNITDQFERLIPSDAISKIMNLSSWSIFAFILIYAGTKISSLGISLLKN